MRKRILLLVLIFVFSSLSYVYAVSSPMEEKLIVNAVIPEDFGIEPEYEGIAYDLVVDGKVMYENLKKINKDYNWLKKQVSKFGIEPKQALIVTIDGKGEIFCQEKAKYS